MNFFSTIISTVLLSAGVAQAANEIGNGGDWVVHMHGTLCADYEVLDYVEGRMTRGIEYDLDAAVGGRDTFSNDQDFREALIQEFLGRIRKYSTSKADLYQSWIKNFYAESKFINGHLTDINDSSHIALPFDHSVVQAVIQRTPEFPQDKRYFIAQPEWQYATQSVCERGVNQINEVGMILHEIIYRDALTRGHSNSIKARYFHSIVTSSKFKDFDGTQWQALLNMSDLD